MQLRRQIKVRGHIQGVGFRPFVYRRALKYSLIGFVRNEYDGVMIDIQGPKDSIHRFIEELSGGSVLPTAIGDITIHEASLTELAGFCIQPSQTNGDCQNYLPPDVAICDNCRAEVQDPGSRRYQYPFTTCTRCGPRFTLLKTLPFDRNTTAMANFQMCKLCHREYTNPNHSRFHSQTNSCASCGPKLTLINSNGIVVDSDRLVQEAAKLILRGYIIAVKGVGGFHLVCDATNESVVARLRRRKRRPHKPFAVMDSDIDAVSTYCDINPLAVECLKSDSAPIVLLRKKSPNILAENVSPQNPFVGMMLPYTPLHITLLANVGRPIIMTSGNHSGLPIEYDNDSALNNLHKIVDFFLVHDRDIVRHTDDSVIKVIHNHRLVLRRSRGYAPRPIAVAREFNESILAVGGHLKSTFAFGKHRNVILSQHHGDLQTHKATQTLAGSIEDLMSLFRFRPQLIAHDLHPDYASTILAKDMARRESIPTLAVQHHHAHMVSCMAEHGLQETVMGVIFDGSGYGSNGDIWGGEFLVGDERSFHRIGHFRNIRLPGGEQAVREPWRMALALLWDAGCEWNHLEQQFSDYESVIPLIKQVVRSGLNSPWTSSCGRLFDGIAALCGLCPTVTFEGQAAIRLEQLALLETSSQATPYPFEFSVYSDNFAIDFRPMVQKVWLDLIAEQPVALIAKRFHLTIVEVVSRSCLWVRQNYGLRRVVLSGGVFVNEIILALTMRNLVNNNFEVYCQSQAPTNDGGLALGQAVVAAANREQICV